MTKNTNFTRTKQERHKLYMLHSVIRIYLVTIITSFFVLVLGFVYFFCQIEVAGEARPRHGDAIIVFSGDAERIKTSTKLLSDGFSKQLIIVGQDNKNEIETLRASNVSLFSCCVKVDQGSMSTAEDAKLAKTMLAGIPVRSLILVTSSFHMPRARMELKRQFPSAVVIPYGTNNRNINFYEIISDKELRSLLFEEYIHYIASIVPINKRMYKSEPVRKLFDGIVSLQSIFLIFLFLLTLGVGLFAVMRHLDKQQKHLL